MPTQSLIFVMCNSGGLYSILTFIQHVLLAIRKSCPIAWLELIGDFSVPRSKQFEETSATGLQLQKVTIAFVTSNPSANKHLHREKA